MKESDVRCEDVKVVIEGNRMTMKWTGEGILAVNSE